MAGIRFNDPFTGAIDILANNGITNNAGTLQLGGALIQNTTLSGAFTLNLSNAAAGFAVGAAASATHKIYGLNTITAPTNGTAAGLFQTAATPAANVTGTVNIYGSASTLDLTLTAASINTAASVNITGHLASLVLRGGAAQSSGILSAARATLNIYDAVNAADVRILSIKAPEVSGTGAAITNLYGLHIEAQKIAAATTAYGIYQAGANDSNYFAGISQIVGGLSVGGTGVGGSFSLRRSTDGNPVTIFTQTPTTLTISNGAGNIFISACVITPATQTNAAAGNNSIYYSSDAGKLVYKDAAGVVNNLY